MTDKERIIAMLEKTGDIELDHDADFENLIAWTSGELDRGSVWFEFDDAGKLIGLSGSND